MALALSAKERAEKTVSELVSYKDLLDAFTSQFTDLNSFIAEIDKSLALRQEELQAKEKTFEEQNLQSLQALDRRESAIPLREQSSLLRLQQQKDAAIAKYSEPVTEKHDIMDVDAHAADEGKGDGEEVGEDKGKGECEEEHEDKEEAEKGTSNGDAPMKETEIKEAPATEAEDNKETTVAQTQVRARPQIVSLCESMDGEGLRKYIVEHRKEIVPLRNDVTVALHSAIDPPRLVLNALEGYHVLELDSNHAKETGASTNRRACILLLECLAEVLTDPTLDGEQQPVVPPSIKEAAKEVAQLWRSKRDATLSSASDGGNENSLDAQAFLQLLVTFGITSEFGEDELLKLVYAVCRRRQTPALCQALGLKHKIPGFLEILNKDGKQIEALCFAHYFGLMDKIQPATMLKAYLKEVRKSAQDMPKNGANPKHESMMRELSAVKAVLRAVEEYNLADQFATDGLQRRLAQLEKSKVDRRKPAMMGKGQMQFKKPRLSGGGQGVAGLPHASYAMSNQATYDRRSQAAYGAVYGTDSRSPGTLSNSYVYSADGSVYQPAASGYTNLSAGYSGYPYGPGVVTQTTYQSSYLR